MGTQADLSHLLCASAATALQPDPPAETPVGAAARTSAILKRLRQQSQMRDSLGCIHHGMQMQHFKFPDAQMPTGTCNHIPAGVSLVVTAVPQLSVLHRSGLLSTPQSPRALHVTSFHHRYSTHPPWTLSAIHYSGTHYPRAKASSLPLLLFPRFERQRHGIQFPCQVFPRWRDLVLLDPLQSMFARDVPIVSSF